MDLKTLSEFNKLADEWNSKYPIGTLVRTPYGHVVKIVSPAEVNNAVPYPFVKLDGFFRHWDIRNLTPLPSEDKQPEGKEPTSEFSDFLNKYAEELNKKIEQLAAIKNGVNICIESKVKLDNEEWQFGVKRYANKVLSSDLDKDSPDLTI